MGENLNKCSDHISSYRSQLSHVNGVCASLIVADESDVKREKKNIECKVNMDSSAVMFYGIMNFERQIE